jgi:hypothetical protein
MAADRLGRRLIKSAMGAIMLVAVSIAPAVLAPAAAAKADHCRVPRGWRWACRCSTPTAGHDVATRGSRALSVVTGDARRWNDAQMKAYGRCIWLPEIADVRSSPRRTPDVIATEVRWLPEVPLGLGLEDAIAS